MSCKWFLPLVFLALTSCVKDRILPSDNGNPVVGPDTSMMAGILKINEFVVTGSPNVNEFGLAEDWIEIFNPSFSSFAMAEGEWYISDAGPSSPKKYMLPALEIPARGFLVIWCDNRDTVATQIHSNFALSSQGEHLVVYHEKDGVGTLVDNYEYGPGIPSGHSMGRLPDGEDNWILFPVPTIGASNQ